MKRYRKNNSYSHEFRLRCIELYQTMTANKVYELLVENGDIDMPFSQFQPLLSQWASRYGNADMGLLRQGTFKGMMPKGATVQVDQNGDIKQVWVKEGQEEEIDYEELFAKARELVVPIEPSEFELQHNEFEDLMLEIPLFDMHFGINDLFDYRKQLNDIKSKFDKTQYKQVFIPIGQDLFHNDDFRGRTTKGTQIEKVDVERAWAFALKFYTTIINCALKSASNVHLSFSEGNHDETLGWAFFQCLEALYQNAINLTTDCSRSPRKVFHWEKIFIGYGHCDDGRTSQKDLRMQFTIEFPREFADSDVREVHCGHMHTEIASGDINGVMVRRLSTANKTDSWHLKNGYVGNHKRFQLFEYSPNELKAIYYI